MTGSGCTANVNNQKWTMIGNCLFDNVCKENYQHQRSWCLTHEQQLKQMNDSAHKWRSLLQFLFYHIHTPLGKFANPQITLPLFPLHCALTMSIPSYLGSRIRHMACFQWAQHALCRVVMLQCSHFCSFSPTTLNKQLQWLPIECRIRFKLVVLTYKALNTGRPAYLVDLLPQK